MLTGECLLYAITAQGLGRKFGERWAIRDLNLEIEGGEVFGLLGPNGAGKTTTMRMLACLIAPSKGEATVAGFDVRKDPNSIRRKVGILCEPAGLYQNLSALRNLEYFAKLYDLEPACAKAQIEKYLVDFQLWDRREEPAGTFSRGMMQKLSLARALLHEPAVVILDEPTSSLDPEGAKVVRDAISNLKGQGRTIILCTHNLNEAQSLCDRVAIIRTTALRIGTPRELQQSLYGRQVEIRIANPLHDPGDAVWLDALLGRTMNDLALLVTPIKGVGDVAVSGDRLLVSMLDLDEVTPRVVRALIQHGVDIVRVAEVEHTLEGAYLDLIARQESAERQVDGRPKVDAAR
jgi:ABC-2 type transport system ATP-binding protein